MANSVFYSWQSDLPTKVNRNFIRTCLDAAVKKINKEIDVEESKRESLKTEDGVKGIPGTPDVANKIFERIDQCEVFVADISVIGKVPKGRRVQNPNVMIEYGRATKSVGDERILTVFNEAFGNWQRDRPFDLQHKLRPITYSLKESASDDDRLIAKDILSGQLERGLKEILGASPASKTEPVKETLSDKAAKLRTQRELEDQKKRFSSSVDGVKAARQAYSGLVERTQIRVKDLDAEHEGLGLNTVFHANFLVIQGMGPVMVVHWRSRFANDLKESFLEAATYDGPPQLPGFNPVFDKPSRLSTRKFTFGLLDNGETGYVSENTENPTYSVSDLVEHLLELYFAAAEKFPRR